jgi:hypothetical protein
MVWMPEELYRVESSTSVSRFSEKEGILAGEQTWLRPNTFHDKMSLEVAIGRHLDWYNTIPTPFISMSSSLTKTRNEAIRRKKMGHDSIRVIVIDRSMLQRTGEVVNLEEMVNKWRLTVPEHLEKWITPTEYIAFCRIHQFTVTSVHDVEGFEEFWRQKTFGKPQLSYLLI